MRRCLIGLTFLALFLGFHVTPASVTTGKMKVIVKDAGGTVLRGAQVTAGTVDSLTKRSGNTDESGEVVLLGLDPSARYAVTTYFPGYVTGRNDNVLVRTGETTTVRVKITPGMTETVHVVEQGPLVDVTTATAGQDLNLDLIEALPSARTYQSYLQFVPGVGPASMPGFGDDPASRSGLNQCNCSQSGGLSSDNYYYLEGINVTGIYGGTSTANFNTEAILEQNVITGGIPAAYKGAPGLISNVVTKSGGNVFSGSVNYFLQHDGLMATDRRDDSNSNDFRNYDTAFTLGGPIRRDKAWFFVSYRKDNRKDFVLNADPVGGFTRTVEEDEDQYYAKMTWQMTNKDRLSGTLMADPRDDSGTANSDIVNERLHVVERGSTRYILNYQRVFGSGVLELSVAEHPNEAHGRPVLLDTYNQIGFDWGQSFTVTDEQLGGGGTVWDWKDTNEIVNGSVEWLVDSSWGHHTIKGGFEFEDHESKNDFGWLNDGGYISANTGLEAFLGMPVTADYMASGNFSGGAWFNFTNPTHYSGLIDAIDASPNSASHYALLDTSGSCIGVPPPCTDGPDGTISMAEMGSNLVFDSTAGNPHGAVNYFRYYQPDHYLSNIGSEGLSLYLQDTLQRGKWTFNAGVRAETWEHFDSSGAKIMDFDWVLAPRVSAIVDIRGDGKQKLSAFFGRYYDPVRTNMTDFAGTLQQPLEEYQLFVNGEWLTFRQFGGPNVNLATFSPTTPTPYTDEWQLGYEVDLGRNMSLTTNIIKRKTRDLMEDYWLPAFASFDPDDPTQTYYPGCWTDPDVGYVGTDACAEIIAHPDSLFLGLDYFGFTEFPDSIYVIGPLAGGYRDYEGFELIFRKRLANRWQAIASYSYGDAHGNTNSDSSASLQADFIQLDPRAPNATGRIPGTVKHQVKVLGSYAWDNGIKLGATYRWYSGMYDNKLLQQSVPVLTGYPGSTMPTYEYAGFEYEWIEYGAVGGLESSAWNVMDIRAQYNHRFGSVATEFFVDVLSVFNSQQGWRRMPYINGAPWIGLEFGDDAWFAPPRRFYVGARASF